MTCDLTPLCCEPEKALLWDVQEIFDRLYWIDYLSDGISAPTSFKAVTFSLDFHISSGAIDGVGSAKIVESQQQMQSGVRLLKYKKRNVSSCILVLEIETYFDVQVALVTLLLARRELRVGMHLTAETAVKIGRKGPS